MHKTDLRRWKYYYKKDIIKHKSGFNYIAISSRRLYKLLFISCWECLVGPYVILDKHSSMMRSGDLTDGLTSGTGVSNEKVSSMHLALKHEDIV